MLFDVRLTGIIEPPMFDHLHDGNAMRLDVPAFVLTLLLSISAAAARRVIQCPVWLVAVAGQQAQPACHARSSLHVDEGAGMDRAPRRGRLHAPAA